MSEITLHPNSLLERLEPGMRLRYAQRLQRVRLRRGEVLHQPGELARSVHFPLTGLVAILTETVDGDAVQTGMVGCHGAVGALEAFVGGQHFAKCLVQVPGEALRLSAPSFRALFEGSPGFRQAVELFFETTLFETRQCVVCNALHTVESRVSRSILDVIDHSCIEGPLPLTQDALAQMLGAQRSTVAVTMSKLQKAGLIRCGRGLVEVRDKPRLERLACSCRRTLTLARREMMERAAPGHQPINGDARAFGQTAFGLRDADGAGLADVSQGRSSEA